jgi:hypothetical protein
MKSLEYQLYIFGLAFDFFFFLFLVIFYEQIIGRWRRNYQIYERIATNGNNKGYCIWECTCSRDRKAMKSFSS